MQEHSEQLSEFRGLKQSLPSSSVTPQTICKSNDFDNAKQEEIRMKMGELIKEMADSGLNPRLIFGKGNVKAQRERYKKRVVEEQRFKCDICSKIFSCKSNLKHHTINKVCEKPTLTKKEYDKLYREKNKDKRNEQNKKYREQQKKL